MKRFFKKVSVETNDDAGYEVLLDGRPLRVFKTKQPLAFASKNLAGAVADEWAALPDSFDQKQTPLTCFLSGATVLSDEDRANIVKKIKACLPCDTLCCVTPEPERLKTWLREKFQPVLNLVNKAAETDFELGYSLSGIVPSPKSSAFVDAYLAKLSNVTLACVQRLASEYGSFLLAFAVERGLLDAGVAFDVSIAEELYQNQFWPTDAEALAVRTNKRDAVLFAQKVLTLQGEK